MLKRFTAKSVLIVFTIGILCVALSGPGVSLSKHGFANASLPTGCAGKIPLLPGTKSQRSGGVCASDQLFNVLSGGFAPAQAHAQLELAIVPADGFDNIASLKYLLRAIGLTYPLQKVPLYLFNSVLTV
jgi:hypothetical protein